MSRWFVPYVILFILAFALRIGLVAVTVGLSSPPKQEANPDQIDYEALAYHLTHGEGYVIVPGQPTASRPPGTSFVLAPVYAIFGRNFAAARLWFCLLSALCVPVVGAVAERLTSRRIGWLAALWLAFYPGHAYYAIHFLSETPATFATAIALLLQLATLRRALNWRDFALGLVLGSGILVRPGLAVMAAALLLAAFGARSVSLRTRVCKASVVVSAVCLVVVPWLARNQHVVGRPVLSTIVGGYTYWGANNPRVYDDADVVGYWVATSTLVDGEHPLAGTEIEREEAAWSYGRQHRDANLDKLPQVMLHRFGRVLFAYRESGNATVDLAFRGAWLVSLPFVLVGIVVILRRTPLEGLILLGPVAAVLVVTVTFYGCARFRDGAAPTWAVCAAAGLATVVRWFRPAAAR